MPDMTYADALNIAIKEEMRRDESVFIMGESIRGGIYGVTGGLSQEFGDRVIDTPLSENGFMGAAVGAAAVGMRPIVQSLSSFLWVAMDQLISQAAKMRFMFGGQVNLPVVYRCGMIYGANSAAHHTDRPYPDADEHARPEDSHSHDSRRRQGSAKDRRPRQRPRDVLRGQQPHRHTRRGGGRR